MTTNGNANQRDVLGRIEPIEFGVWPGVFSTYFVIVSQVRHDRTGYNVGDVSVVQIQIPGSVCMHANNVCHFAIHADDVERAKSFYQRAFGWQFEEWGPPDFYLIKTGNDSSPGILGALQKRTEPLGTGFSGYECSISVEDIRKTEAIIVEAGGTIYEKPVEIPTVGVLFKFADTEGNVACAIQYFSKT